MYDIVGSSKGIWGCCRSYMYNYVYTASCGKWICICMISIFSGKCYDHIPTPMYIHLFTMAPCDAWLRVLLLSLQMNRFKV